MKGAEPPGGWCAGRDTVPGPSMMMTMTMAESTGRGTGGGEEIELNAIRLIQSQQLMQN